MSEMPEHVKRELSSIKCQGPDKFRGRKIYTLQEKDVCPEGGKKGSNNSAKTRKLHLGYCADHFGPLYRSGADCTKGGIQRIVGNCARIDIKQ